MARRNSYYKSAGPLGSCSTIAIITIAVLFKWITENPALSVIIALGIAIVVLLIVYLVNQYKH